MKVNKRNFVIFSIFLIMFIFAFMIPLTSAKAASPPDVASAFPDLPAIWAVIEPRLIVLLVLTLFDFLFGVILSIIAKDFKWEYLLHYLNTDILPILAWMAFAVMGTIPAEFLPQGILPIVADGVYATVSLAILASLYGHFKTIGVLSAEGKTNLNDRLQ